MKLAITSKKARGRENTYKVSFNHILGNFISEANELLLAQLLSQLVVQIEVKNDLTRPAPPNPMNVLERELHPLVVGDLDPTDTHAFDAQAPKLQAKSISK